MVILYSGQVQVEWLPKEASTAFNANSFVRFDGTGDLLPAVADGTTSIAGVCLRKVVAADADYAVDGAKLPVWVPMPNSVFLADASGAAATRLMIGNTYDIVDDLTVDLGAVDHPVVTVVDVIDSTHVLIKINSAYEYKNAS